MEDSTMLTIQWTKSLVAAGMLVTLMASPVSAFVNTGKNAYVVHADRGGNVANYIIKARGLRQQSRKIRFAGRCESACTILLSHPKSDICITRNAKFGFHLPYGGRSEDNTKIRSRMMAVYPSWVRSWIGSKGGLNGHMKTMTYAYASRFLRTCA